jgi:hypothetical protein
MPRPIRLLALAACLLALVAATGCGGGDKTLASGCVIADVSPSTVDARADYLAQFQAFAMDVGQHGSGHLCVILAAGDPMSEGHLTTVDVGPDHDKPNERDGEIRQKVDAETATMGAVLADPAITQQGSALVEAAVAVSDRLKPGDRLLFLSDGVEHTPTVGNFRTADLSSAGIDQLLAQLDGDRLQAPLDGVQIVFPSLLAHPGGFHISPAQQAGIRLFWQRWTSASGAAGISFATVPGA